MCKPLGEIAVDEIRIKLHLTKVSLVQSVNFISCIFPPKGLTEILETILHNFLRQEQKQIGIKSLYFAMRFNTKMRCDNIIKQTPVYY